MDAVKFLEELHRMCLATDGCRTCAIRHAGSYCPSYLPKIEETVAIVEKWSAEHPVKSILMDFLEKCPKTPLINGIPDFPPRQVGYCGEGRITCSLCERKHGLVRDCWNLPLEE